VRVGYMALFAMNGKSSIEGSTAAILNYVAKALATGRFAHQAPVYLFITCLKVLHYLDCAINAGALFIAGDEEANRAFMARVLLNEAFYSGGHGGQAPLHVGCATAI